MVSIDFKIIGCGEFQALPAFSSIITESRARMTESSISNHRAIMPTTYAIRSSHHLPLSDAII